MNDHTQSNLMAIGHFLLGLGAIIAALTYAYSECAGQQRVELIPKYFSAPIYPSTGNLPNLGMLDDSFANWIQTDNLHVGCVFDSVPSYPNDTAFVTFRTADAVEVQVLWSTWNRGILFSLCDTTGPLDWNARAFPIHAVREQGDERQAQFIILWVSPAKLGGAENLQDKRVYWGRMEMGKAYSDKVNYGNPYSSLRAQSKIRWYNILGMPVDSMDARSGFYFTNDGRKIFR